MARPKSIAPPAYKLHKPSGQARVRADGKEVYLGKFGSPVSIAAYQKLVNEWLKAGSRLPENLDELLSGGDAATPTPMGVTVVELVDQYREWSVKEYGAHRNGEHGNTMEAVAPVVRMFGRLEAAAFGPNALRKVRDAMVNGTHRTHKPDEPKPRPLSRRTINDRVHRIRRVFRWAVEHQLVSPIVIQGLDAVAALKAGRGHARESDPVKPVSEETVTATIPHLPWPVGDMVRVQLVTGMRSGELCRMRPCDIDMSNPSCWLYRPARHKNTHRGYDRAVWLGPQAQKIIAPHLTGKPNEYIFSPRRAQEARFAKLRAARKSPVQPSQINRQKSNAKRRPGARYRVGSYAYAVVRACAKYGIEHWHPHQIRHTVATRLRGQYGIETARVILGHNTVNATQLYAQADQEKAASVMQKIG